MPFNPDAYLAKKQTSEGFNPDAYLAKAQPKTAPAEDTGLLNTALTQTGAGLSGGFDDEIAGALSGAGRVAGVENLGGKFKDIGLSPEGPTMDWEKIKQEYIKTRDATRDVKNRQQQEHPAISLAANIGGALVNPIGAEAGLGKATALGAAAGLGSSDAELAGPNKQIAKAAVDTGVGGALGLAGGVLGKVAGFSGQGAKEAAAEQAAKAVRMAPGIDKGAEAAGQSLLESGSLPITGSQQVLNQSIQGAKQTAGEEIGKALGHAQSGITDDAIQQAGPISEKFSSLTDDFLKNSNLNDIDSRQVLAKAKSEFGRISESEGDLNALNKIKQDFQQLAKKTYGPNSPAQNSSIQNFYNKAADLVKSHIEDLGNAGEAGAGQEIAEANAAYGPLKAAAAKTQGAAKSEALDGSALDAFNLGKYVTNPVQQFGKLAGIKDTGLLANTASANMLNSPVVQGAAEAAGVAGEALNPLVRGAVQSGDAKKNIYQQHQQQYRDYSNKLLANPKTQHLGKALDAALNSNNELNKTQALFVIQQNPQARKVIDSDASGESEIA